MRLLACRLKTAASRLSTRRFASEHGKDEYGGGVKLWERLSYFVALPAVGLGMLNVYLDDHGHHRTEFIKYDYLRMITKPFPWGDGKRGLFFNPKVNALPDGYIDDEDEHH